VFRIERKDIRIFKGHFEVTRLRQAKSGKVQDSEKYYILDQPCFGSGTSLTCQNHPGPFPLIDY
jgi:hypothetical protein